MGGEEIVTAQTTLVILLGASQWPRWSDLDASEAFANSAREVRNYFLDAKKFHLPEENLLYLFDSDQSADDIDDTIDQFLQSRIEAMKTHSQAARDVLIYFIGHAGFGEEDEDYYLAIRRTREGNPETSALRITSLARTLKKNTRWLRCLVILDCCYAAAAFRAFQSQGGGIGVAAIRQTYEAFRVPRLSNDALYTSWPRKGTALLCSSSRSRPSLLGEQYTAFSEALLHVLNTGSTYEGKYLSLYAINELIKEFYYTENHQGSKPEVHDPDQSDGSVGRLPFFPNPHIQIRESQTLCASDLSELHSSVPVQVSAPHLRHRRGIFITVLCIALLTGIGGGTWLPVNQYRASTVNPPLATAMAAYQVATAGRVQFGFDAAHTHWNRAEKMVSMANLTRLTQLWSYTTNGNIDTSPVVANGLLYMSSPYNYLYVFDAMCRHACEPLWSYQIGGSGSGEPTIVVANSKVYVGSEYGKFYAFDAMCRHACEPLWSYQIGSSGPKIAVTNNRVYVSSIGNSRLYTFDAMCRHACPPLWSYQFSGTIDSFQTVADNKVYVSSQDGKLYAFDATCSDSCQPLWSYQLDPLDQMDDSIVISSASANGLVYIGTENDILYAFDMMCRSRCEPLWSYQFGGSRLLFGSPQPVANGLMYVGSDNVMGLGDGTLYAFDATCRSRCQPLWSYQAGDFFVIADGLVYGLGINNLYVFDATCRRVCQPLWSYQISVVIPNQAYEVSFSPSPPAVVNSLMYVGFGDGKLYAFSTMCRSRCQPLWSYQLDSSPLQFVSHQPVAANGLIYVGSGDGILYAFDTTCHSRCQPLWFYQTGGAISSSPIVDNGIVYVGSDDKRIYAFDGVCRRACQPLWSYQTDGVVSSSPAVANGIVYVGSDDTHLYAFDATCRRACQPLWSYRTDGTISSSPTVANGIVYVGSDDKRIYAFDAACRHACQPLWFYQTTGEVGSSPAVANGIVYVDSKDGKLYAFDITCHSACQPLWSYQISIAWANETRTGIFWFFPSSPAVANGIVYVGSNDKRIYAFDAACRQACQPLWSYQTVGEVWSSPTVANGVLYVGSNDSHLYAFDAACRHACQPLWSYQTAGEVWSSPTVANGVLYVGSRDGKLYALGLVP